jgi:hypothetical protein
MTLSERSVLRVHTSNRKKQNRGSYMLLELFRLFRLFQPHNVLRFSISLPIFARIHHEAFATTTSTAPSRSVPYIPIPDTYLDPFSVHTHPAARSFQNTIHTQSRSHKAAAAQPSCMHTACPSKRSPPLPVVREINKHASMHSTRASVSPSAPK